MSNSQEQSLNEYVVFPVVNETSPEFLHCERERRAVESLLSAGPGAFYASLNAERLDPFLSPGEVNQISAWSQDFCSLPRPQEEEEEEKEKGEEEEEEEGEMEGAQEEAEETLDFSVRYFPMHSDTPAPCLELGWPDRVTWMGMGHAMVYTNPPTEGAPPIREVIRRHLRSARRVIAIVTDRLTDSAVIGDLHSIACMGLPVYIILNQRSLQENASQHRLRHPNIKVRVLGGKSFRSHEGKVVTGELKDNFLLIDLEIVLLGSYSLTWSDTHLHRQLVTELSGPVVEAFDQEFRTLYAASLPVPDDWKAAGSMVRAASVVSLHRPELTDPGDPGARLQDGFVSPPLTPPTDCTMDWEALGVVKRGEEVLESPFNLPGPALNFSPLLVRQAPVKGSGGNEINLGQAPVAMNEPRSTPKTELVYFRHLSTQKSNESDEKQPIPPREPRKDTSQNHELLGHQRRDRPIRREDVPDQVTQSGLSSGRPVILRVPQSDDLGPLGDYLKRMPLGQTGPSEPRRESNPPVTPLSRSMLDLSAPQSDTGASNDRVSAAQRPHGSYFDPARLTPALALMKKRNDEIKAGILRPPKTFLPGAIRPRSSSFILHKDWRKLQADQNRWRGEDQ